MNRFFILCFKYLTTGPDAGSYGGLFYVNLVQSATFIKVVNCSFNSLNMATAAGGVFRIAGSTLTNITVYDSVFSNIVVCVLYFIFYLFYFIFLFYFFIFLFYFFFFLIDSLFSVEKVVFYIQLQHQQLFNILVTVVLLIARHQGMGVVFI
jgi:hypothetical protein